MHSLAPVALATLFAATAPALLSAQAQAPTPFTVPQPAGKFTDPANLAGERPNPRTGRELPIDGGPGPDGKPDTTLALAQLLRKLNTRASLMLIVAHPDDEDGGMLAYYSRGLGARVAMLTLNRGEGGQNAMTGDFEDALGLLRTQELLAADRYMGVDTQMFGTEVDFGFTKTKAEAFAKWNHQRVLYDAVRAVRIFRPLVIASVFEGAVTDGHGQHQVAGQIAQEVFKAAGDPNVFPELTREGILPWQPLKVYERVPFSRVTAQGLYDYATGQTVPAEFTNYVTGQKFTTEPTADITINEGAADPLLTTCAANPADLPHSLSSRSGAEGSASPFRAPDCAPLSYVQFARIGLGLQRSQIPAGMRVPPAGRVDASYHLYGSRVCAPNLPNPTPNLCAQTSSTALSSRPEARSVVAERPASWLAIAFAPSTNLAPTAHTRASTSNAVILRDRSEAQGLFSSSENSPTLFSPELSHAPSFFDGIDTSVAGLAALIPSAPSQITTEIQALDSELRQVLSWSQNGSQRDGVPVLVADTLNRLVAVIKMVEAAPLEPGPKATVLQELRIKQVQLNQALVFALGISFNATIDASHSAEFIAGSSVPVETTLTMAAAPQVASGIPAPTVTLKSISLQADEAAPEPENQFSTPLQQNVSIHKQLTFDHKAPPTRPYFTRANIDQPVYTILRPALRNAPETPPALVAVATLHYGGVGASFDFTVSRVVHKDLQAVRFIPPVSLTLDRNAQVVPNGTHALNIDVHTETEDHPTGELHLHAPQDWTIRSPERPLRAGTQTFSASLPAPLQTSTLKAEATISGSTYTEGFRPVGYGTLPRTNFYTPATLRVVPVDLKLPPPDKRRIGYLPGTGDAVPEALASIGLAPSILKVSDLTPANLARFDTVILGVRTYAAHPDLHGAPTQALLDYARNGGNVVVQYQTPEFTAADAPYPLTDRNERVIDETAPVSLLLPGVAAGFSPRDRLANHDGALAPGLALLTTPNRITPADFNNWIEERGHGFLDTWDPHYTALTETHDPGAPAEHILPQPPQRGGLVTVHLGRGRWTYCAFALYRQLPEAVPGAFRLFVNLLNP